MDWFNIIYNIIILLRLYYHASTFCHCIKQVYILYFYIFYNCSIGYHYLQPKNQLHCIFPMLCVNCSPYMVFCMYFNIYIKNNNMYYLVQNVITIICKSQQLYDLIVIVYTKILYNNVFICILHRKRITNIYITSAVWITIPITSTLTQSKLLNISNLIKCKGIYRLYSISLYLILYKYQINHNFPKTAQTKKSKQQFSIYILNRTGFKKLCKKNFNLLKYSMVKVNFLNYHTNNVVLILFIVSVTIYISFVYSFSISKYLYVSIIYIHIQNSLIGTVLMLYSCALIIQIQCFYVLVELLYLNHV